MCGHGVSPLFAVLITGVPLSMGREYVYRGGHQGEGVDDQPGDAPEGDLQDPDLLGEEVVILEDQPPPCQSLAHVEVGQPFYHDVVLQGGPSPKPTELEVSDESEMVLDSPKRGCYCDHEMGLADRQPESFEDWYRCDHCKYERKPENPDEVETQAGGDVVPEAVSKLMSQLVISMITPQGEVFVRTDDGFEKVSSPRPEYRRLRPLISEPLMVDSPQPSPSGGYSPGSPFDEHDHGPREDPNVSCSKQMVIDPS